MTPQTPSEFVVHTGTLIRQGLGLAEDQVILANERFRMPGDQRLYVMVQLLGAKLFGSKAQYENDPNTSGLSEVRGCNVQEIHQVMAYSLGGAARQRYWEIPVALSGNLAQQRMERYSFRIGQLPTSMTEVSLQDGAGRLNRYSMTFQVLGAYRTQLAVDYFDTFRSPLLTTNQ